MKKVFRIILGAALTLNLVGCDDEKEAYPNPAPLPYDMVIGIFDDEGNNLLSENAEGNWLYAPISITIYDYPKNIDWGCFRPQESYPWSNIDPATGKEKVDVKGWAEIIRTSWSTTVVPTDEMVDSYAFMLYGPFFPNEKNDIYVNFLELNQVVHIEFGSYLADRKSPDGKKYSCYVNGIGNPVDKENNIIPVRIVLPHRSATSQTD